MAIDVFCHVVPPKYLAAINKKVADGVLPPLQPLFSWELQNTTLYDMDARFKLMDQNPDVREIISVTGMFLETFAPPKEAIELARLANDEVAELVAKYPDRFAAGLAFLPCNDIDGTLSEIDRAINDLNLRGIEIGTDIAGKPLDSPEFMSIYEKMEKYDLPVFIHPSKNSFFPDYPGETESRYGIFAAIGWPYTTSMAMLRLVHGGVLEKYPGIKFVTHHAGGTIPFLAKRIELGDQHQLPKPLTEYLRLFYNDTAVQGNTANLMCAYAFFGSKHLVFATDFPFGGPEGVSTVLRSIGEMDIPQSEKEEILEENAGRMFKL